MRLEPDSILGLNGMGPKAMSESDALNGKFPPRSSRGGGVEEGEAVQIPAAEPV
jgi:hypothetical protein